MFKKCAVTTQTTIIVLFSQHSKELDNCNTAWVFQMSRQVILFTFNLI